MLVDKCVAYLSTVPVPSYRRISKMPKRHAKSWDVVL